MEFPGPDTADLAEVHALNRAFLDYVAGAGLALTVPLQRDLREALAQSGTRTRERMGKCPFLLFTLGESEPLRWTRVFDGRPVGDLVDALSRPGPDELRISSAAIAFLWQFARRNPYAARVVSGAPNSWCERLAACSLVDLFDFAAHSEGLLHLRFGERHAFWQRLLLAGTSSEPEVRRTARVTALQTILTEPVAAVRQSLPAAACAMSVPVLEVADRTPVPQSGAGRYNTPPHESPLDSTTRKNLPQR